MDDLKVTEETKKYLIDVFSTYYFEPTRKDKVSTVLRFQISVDRYLDYKNIDKRPVDLDNDELKKYWFENFGFLLDIPNVVKSINKRIQEEKSVKDKENIYLLRSLITFIWLTILHNRKF
jgi:hypothetical protein